MGAAAMVIALAGLVLPISLILLAVVVDLVALLWAAYVMWHDRWAPAVWAYLAGHVGEPTVRLARTLGGPHPH